MVMSDLAAGSLLPPGPRRYAVPPDLPGLPPDVPPDLPTNLPPTLPEDAARGPGARPGRGGPHDAASLQEVTKIFGGPIASTIFPFGGRGRTWPDRPNGAGKDNGFSTALTGNYTPERGRIFFDGEPITGLKPHRVVELGIARTFQSIRLFGKLPVLENVLAGRHCRMKAGLFARMLHTMASAASEKAAVARAAWEELRFVGLADRRAEAAAEACPTAISGCWKSRAPWLRDRAPAGS